MSFESLVRDDTAGPPVEAPRRSFLGLELRRPAQPMVGLSPQVSLLPPELRDAERRKGFKRGALAGLAGVVVLTVLGVGAANLAAGAAQARLEAETKRTQVLSAQVLKFADVQKLQQEIALGDAAVRVGSSTAIDWQKQLGAILADMPDGYVVTTVSADGATPIADYPQGTSPLDAVRAATVTLTMTTSSITELPVWLRELRSLPAYGDVTPAVSAGSDAGYNVLITLHLTDKAFVTPISKGAK